MLGRIFSLLKASEEVYGIEKPTLVVFYNVPSKKVRIGKPVLGFCQ
jgi:hypothetical protein